MKKSLFYIFFALIFLSCATLGVRFDISVDAISNKQTINNKKYIILSGVENVNSNDLQFQEYANYVKKALATKGYEVTYNLDDAKLVIILSYGIGNPQNHYYSYTLPAYGQTGVTSTTYSFGNYSSTTTTPKYGLTTKQGVGIRTTYTRYIILIAYDLKTYLNTKQEIQIWKTEIVSTGSSNDLRRVFPILIAASQPYFGENTGRQIKLSLYEDSPSVLQIKGVVSE